MLQSGHNFLCCHGDKFIENETGEKYQPSFHLSTIDFKRIGIRIICKVTQLGLRIASFSIIGIKHVAENQNFTKRNNWDPK
jgi:hypothetical protein